MRKTHLISRLQDFQDYPNPNIKLEQYTLDAVCAGDIIYIAGFEHDDIAGKNILDLGCGVGRLMGGALLFGASQAVGIDIDKNALKVARKNLQDQDLGGQANLIQADLHKFHLADISTTEWTILANPPFGVHSKGADTRFIESWLGINGIVYTLHLSSPQNRQFLSKFFEARGYRVDLIYELEVVLARTYQFHTKKRKKIQTNLFRLVKIG